MTDIKEESNELTPSQIEYLQKKDLPEWLTRLEMAKSENQRKLITIPIMKIVYVAHPIAFPSVKENLDDLFRIIRKINLDYPNIAFIANYVTDVQSLNDSVPDERARGIANNIALIQTSCFDECWLTGKQISQGMLQEIEIFNNLDIPVINKIGQL